MKRCIGLLLASLLASSPLSAQPARSAKITWKKTIVDKVFRSEGVAVADVNKDGKPDIIVGDVWYEAPGWKMHPLRKERFKSHDPGQYSDAFAVFADDFNGDGFPDVIVIPFPGNACFWYENPKGKVDELWKEHHLTNSACNETPIYVDLFKTGKKVLVMGWRPQGKGFGEVSYFRPGQDPTKPWDRLAISGDMGRHAPGSDRFYHGLGAGDVNGDGRLDVIVPDGWWEQPEKVDGTAWKWHPTRIGQGCADMHVLDVDNDGKADIISSSAHGYGLWWHQQRPGNAFFTMEFFQAPPALAREPKGIKFSKEEKELFNALAKMREGQRRAPLRADSNLCLVARGLPPMPQKGKSISSVGPLREFVGTSVEDVLKKFKTSLAGKQAPPPGCAVGVGFVDGNYKLVVDFQTRFSLPGQTHALNFVDINGDGLKDLITGRRYWAHGAGGDVHPADPAYLFWFEAKKDKTGMTSFIPHVIDDDSGVGTQFEVIDINGDGLLDVVISNKKGVYVFEQVRAEARPTPPGKKEN